MVWLLASFWAADPPAPADPPPAEDPSPAGDAGSPPSAPPLSAEDLAALEAAMQADAARLTPPPAPAPRVALPQSMNPDLAFIADFALAAFNTDTPRMGGAHDPQVNGFNLQQLELSVGSAVDPYLRLDGNIVFGQFGVEIEEIYATTLGLPGRTQLRAGQFLTRFGRLNSTHPHSWDFVDQPFALSRLMGGEGNRGLGVEASVLLPLPWSVELYLSGTMANGEATARSFWGPEDLGVRGPQDIQSTAVLEQFFPFGPDLSLLWGLSYAGGPNPSGRDNRTELYGTDLYLRYRPTTRQSSLVLTLTSEWILRRRQVPDDVLCDVNGFTQALWRFSPRWAVAGRWELGTVAWGLDGTPATDPLDPDWTATRQRYAVNTTFWPTEFSRLRAQVHLDDAGWDPRPQLGAMLAFEALIGAHGSHEF